MSSKSVKTFNPVDDPIYGNKLNDTGITPVGYKMLIEIPESHEKRKFKNLEIPDDAEDRAASASVVARVLQLGNECYRDKSRYPNGPWCKPGDWIALSPYQGTRIVSAVTNQRLRFINEDCLDGVLIDPAVIERG